MIFSKPKIDILASFETDSFLSSKNLLFLLYNGQSKLQYTHFYGDINSFEDNFYTLTLNGTPLIYVQSSGCPTCESLLAAGYGIPKNNLEIKETVKNLSSSYETLEEALKSLYPIIQLLPSGAYALSESNYFPTDGNKHFFWDIPNEFTYFKATSEIYDYDNYTVFPCVPCYLYPSQSSDKYDESRVKYYRTCIQSGEKISPAITYAIDGYMSILLDGHHRACAAALEKKKLSCLTISPVWYYYNKTENFSTIGCPFGYLTQIPSLTKKQNIFFERRLNIKREIKRYPKPKEGNIFCKTWSKEYKQSVEYFPDCEEAAALIEYPFDILTKEGIEKLLNDNEQNYTKLSVYLFHFLCKQDKIHKKQIAFYFTSVWFPNELRKAAFQILNTIKNDSEIEDFFIDYIINCEDKTNGLRKIADSYWDT